MVTEFLNNNSGHPTDLMRAYLGVMYLLDFNMSWARSLVVLVAKIYKTWRIHWGYELEHEKPEEPLTMECLSTTYRATSACSWSTRRRRPWR